MKYLLSGIEFKKIETRDEETKEIALDSALKQIKERRYAEDLSSLGISRVLGLGIVFCGKRIWVKAQMGE